MTNEELAGALLDCGSAMLHEADGRRGALGPAIRPAWAGARMAGRARTVRIAASDNLAAHLALEAAEPGEVLCVASPASSPFGFWGEVVATYAMARGVVGLLTDQAVRDVRELEQLGFPVFSRGHAIQGTIKRRAGEHQVPVRIGQALVRPGDWVVCDADGGVTIPATRAEAALAAAHRKVDGETTAMAAIRDGRSSRDALGLPAGLPGIR